MGGQASQPIYDAEPTMYGIVFAISAGCILFMLYMSFFGRRMRFTAIRWHTINHNLWNLLQLLAFSHAAIKTPWRDYLAGTFIAQYNELITAFCLSVYPTGMIFVYIEQMVHLFCPRYRDPIFCNSVLWLCVFIFVNTLMVVLFFAFYWWPKEFFYTPILFYQIVVTVLFDFFTGIYFLFCFFTTITHCCVMKRMRRSRGVMFFVNMWLLLPYSVISCIMIAPKFSFTMAMFIIQFFIDFIIELMMKNPQMAGGNPMMVTWLSLVEPFLLYLPVAQAILTIVCIPMYRQQFIFVITCGRYYTNKAKVGSSCSSTTSWLASSANGFQAGEGKQVPPSEYVSSPPSYPSLDKHDED